MFSILKNKIFNDQKLTLGVFVLTAAALYAFISAKLASNDLPTLYLCLIGIYLFSQQGKLKFSANWLFYLALISAVAIAASSLAPYPDVSFARLDIYRDLFLLGFAVYLSLQNQLEKVTDSLLLAAVIVFLIVTPITLTEQLSYSTNIAPDSARFISPKLSYFSHIRHYSYLAFISSCFALILLVRQPKYRGALLSLLIACVLALLLSTGRAAIAAFLFFALIVFAKRLPLLSLAKWAAVSLALVIAVFILLALSPFSALTDSLILRSQNIGDINQLLSGRVSFWQNSLSSIADSPLLGLGPEGYRWTIDALPSIAQPHNVVVQLFVEYGYFGGGIILVLVLGFIVWCATAKLKDKAQQELHFLLSAFIYSYILFALVDGLFYHTIPMLHLVLVVPTWIYLSQTRVPKAK